MQLNIMKDRFKFRLFNKAEGTMHSDFTALDKYFSDALIKQNYLDYCLIQSTGAKDKNDNLIFEGDIVKFKDEYDIWLIGEIEYDVKDCAYLVKFLNRYSEPDWEFISRYRLEIIGNVYENPELLP